MRSLFHQSLAIATVALTCSFGLSSAASAEEEKSEPKKVSVFEIGEIEVPAEFKPTKPNSRIIQHEFKVGEGEQTARLTMMGAGGGVAPNIKRWKGQFSGGDADAQKTETLKVGDWEVHLVDVSGSYAERMGGGPFFGGKTVQREDYAMAGAIFVAPDQRLYFAKLIGPADVVKANRERFVAMVKTIAE